MAVALALSVELLRFSEESARAKQWLHALTQAGVRVTETTTYRGTADVLALWGPGNPARGAIVAQHVAHGGHAVVFDLAYWQRDHKVRVSFDAPHPSAWVMRRDWPRERFAADQVRVEDRWKPDGPVVVAGIGRKARAQYGDVVGQWEAAMIAAARRAGRPVVYRRKQVDAPIPNDVRLTSDGPIDQVLAGASAVVTWHSNVAVDAIRLGIPVICRDGAAAAVCPSEWRDDLRPLDPALRDRFLANLAWFQWAPCEASACWRWIAEVLA